MTTAYIPTKKDKKHGLLYFSLTENDDEILAAPVNETFFVDEEGKAGFEQLKTELERRYPVVDKVYEKYFPLFKSRFTASYSYAEVTFCMDSSVKLSTRKLSDNAELFASYIKEYGKFHIRTNQIYISYHHSNIELKRALNKYGIYVRPIKGILEHNPKMAKKQMDIVNGKKSRTVKVVDLKNYDLMDLKRDLHALIRQNANLEINYYWNTYRSKKCMCLYIMLFVDLYNIFLKSGSYRYLKSFEIVKICWMQMKQKQKMQYPKVFRSFMNKETKIDSPEPELISNAYQLKVQTNTEIFSNTRYQKDKFYKQLQGLRKTQK
jgi:hypothetical protein